MVIMRAAVVLLCLGAIAGCGSDDERRIQRVAFCQGSSSDNPDGDPIQVDFRQGTKVVATTSGDPGTAFTVEVPLGAVQIYVDGVQRGTVNEGVSTDGPYHSPAPDEVTYLAGEGCPETPPAAPVS